MRNSITSKATASKIYIDQCPWLINLNFDLVKFNHLCIHQFPKSSVSLNLQSSTDFASICFWSLVSIRRDQNADHVRKVTCGSWRSGNPFPRRETLRRGVPEGRWLQNSVPHGAPWGRWWRRHHIHLRCAYVPHLIRFSCCLIGGSRSWVLVHYRITNFNIIF
jgi:hypothetical protein